MLLNENVIPAFAKATAGKPECQHMPTVAFLRLSLRMVSGSRRTRTFGDDSQSNS